MRGQAGTEREALAGAATGARFILLNNAVSRVDFSLSARGLAYDWQAGPDGAAPDTDNFTARSIAFAARSLAPLSPVHLHARPQGGDIRLSWIRRTRIGGDSWEGEVPLGEASERYRVRIYNGAAIVREIETVAPDYLYGSAEIAVDFPGGVGASVTFSVAQLSDAVGAGETASGTAAIE